MNETHQLECVPLTIDTLPPAIKVLLKLHIATINKGTTGFEVREGEFLFATADAQVLVSEGFKARPFRQPGPQRDIRLPMLHVVAVTRRDINRLWEEHKARFRPVTKYDDI